MNWDELSLTFSSWPAGYEDKKTGMCISGKRSQRHISMPKPIHPLRLNTYLNKSKREEPLCLPLGATVEGLAPVFNERRECAIVQVPVKIYIGLPWKQSRLWEEFAVDAKMATHYFPTSIQALTSGPSCSLSGLALWLAQANRASANVM